MNRPGGRKASPAAGPGTGRRSVPAAPRALLSVLALVAASVGCAADGGEADVPAGPTLRDSAGVRIVEWPGAPRPRAAVDVRHLYTVGDDPGEYVFQRPFHGLLLEDGRAAVADLGNDDILLLAADGSGTEVLMARGQGPGEIRTPYGLASPGGDTLWVQDRDNGRLTRLVDGLPDREWSAAGRPLLGAFRTVGIDEAGALLMVTAAFDPRFEEAWFAGTMIRFDVGAERVDTVGTFDMVPRIRREGANPFSGFGEAEVAGDGWAVVRTDRPEIVWRSAGGDVRGIVRWTPPRVHPAGADLEAFVDASVADFREMNVDAPEEHVDAYARDLRSRYALEPDVPLPLFTRPVGAGDGSVWLPEYRPDGSPPSRYLVASPDGAELGWVAFPEPVELMDVAHGRALGRTRDALDVPAVVVYELIPRP